MQTVARGVALSFRGSSPSFKRDPTGVSNTILGSNIQWRGISFAASVPSDSFQPRKGCKRISKQERRAMVESFIDKYRASNAGKFPNASHVRKEIGGSYYFVRQIVQELEYKHKLSPLSKIKEVQLGKAEKFIYPSSGVKEEPSVVEVEVILNSKTTKLKSDVESLDRVKLSAYPFVTDDEAVANLDAKEEPHISKNVVESSAEDPTSHATTVTGPQNKQILGDLGDPSISSAQADTSVWSKSKFAEETRTPLSGAIEGTQNDKSVTEDLLDTHCQGVELTENHKAPKIEELNGDHARRLEHGEPSTKPTGFWGNLKSLADGVISFWKKL